MTLYFYLLFGLLSYVSFVCVSTSRSSGTDNQICWESKWFNDSTTYANGSKSLQPSTQNICTVGSVIGAECEDNGGEGFQGTKNVSSLHFVLICDHKTGAHCQLDQHFMNASCPDLAIRFGCQCPPTTATGGRKWTTVTTSGTTARGKHQVVTGSPGGRLNVTSDVSTKRNSVNGSNVTHNTGSRPATGARKHKCRNRGLQIELNVIMLVLCTLILNVF